MGRAPGLLAGLLRVLADRVEHGEEMSELDKVFAVSA